MHLRFQEFFMSFHKCSGSSYLMLFGFQKQPHFSKKRLIMSKGQEISEDFIPCLQFLQKNPNFWISTLGKKLGKILVGFLEKLKTRKTRLKIFKHYKLKPSFSLIKNEKPPPPSFNKLIKFDPILSSLIQFNPIWSN